MKLKSPITALSMRVHARESDAALLSALLDEARATVLTYTHRKEPQWLEPFDHVAVSLAARAYGRLGAEGLANRKEGDVATAFDLDADAKILKLLDGYRLAGVGA